MLPRALVVGVVALGILLIATTIDGPFTIDENNYLVTVVGLRHGRVSVVGTEGLPPSRELLFFDPAGHYRAVETTPVHSTAPPLYAPLALPFLPLGWRGLVLLNTLAYLAMIVAVFTYLQRGSSDPGVPWMGAIAVGLGAYFIEYAQGMWPHMLAAALASGGVLLGCIALRDARPWWSAGAGFLVALSAGIRYQNAFLMGCLGLALFLLAERRWRVATLYAAAASIPIATSSILNHARLGSWNPISKGSGYLPLPGRTGGPGSGFLADTAIMAWMRIVDYAVQPSMAGTTNESFLYPQPQSGAFVLVTAVKKAWLQSSPWILVSLVLLVLCWMKRDTFARILGSERQAELRLLSMVVIPTLGMFSATGPTRTDGLCFNQRYFCELVPLLAVAFAWATGGIWHRRQWLLGGSLLGAGIAFAALQPHPLAPLRHYLVMYVPLAAAIASAAVWAHFVRRPERTGAARALAFAAGASLAWALTIHVGDDVQASRKLRESRLDYRRQISPYLEGATAVFAGGPIRDALGPLLLERDVVIATPVLDRGATTRDLIDAFLARGRRVFLLPNVLPPDSLNDAIAGKQARFLGEPKLLLEVRRPQGEG